MSILSKGIVIKDIDLPKDGKLLCITITPDGKALVGIDARGDFIEHEAIEVEEKDAWKHCGNRKGEHFNFFFKKGAPI